MSGIQDRLNFQIGPYEREVENRIQTWRDQDFIRRFWAKDSTLWSPKKEPEIVDRMGWLHLPEMMQKKMDDLTRFAEKVRLEGIDHVVLLGMGGSSLAPEVFQRTFGNTPGYPKLMVLDTTHPDAVRDLDQSVDIANALFLVSSKSGTTLETLSFFNYFWKRMDEAGIHPGQNFVAITDPDSPLDRIARDREFRAVFRAPTDIGGRYSAFSVFGLIPAALIGVDVQRLLERGRAAAEKNAPDVDPKDASGFLLGAALGEMDREKDKLTILTSPALGSFPDWLEQLIAESSGKCGKGLIPVANEPRIAVEEYGRDRVFIGLFEHGENSRELDGFLEELKNMGHPVVRIRLDDAYDLGQEIFLWEIGVASAGAILGIHPFNQPDVQLAKELAKKAMSEGSADENKDKRGEEIEIKDRAKLENELRSWIGKGQKGDYLGIQAYLAPNPSTTEALQSIRHALLKKTRLATTLGYGPRFLHSTGQLHKGGPNSGLFLQLVDEAEKDLAVPETDFTFGALIQAQARGDLEALRQRNRRVIRINLHQGVQSGLHLIEDILLALSP
jgi:transaldolase/glucose-6-phosphate isomerase